MGTWQVRHGARTCSRRIIQEAPPIGIANPKVQQKTRMTRRHGLLSSIARLQRGVAQRGFRLPFLGAILNSVSCSAAGLRCSGPEAFGERRQSSARCEREVCGLSLGAKKCFFPNVSMPRWRSGKLKISDRRVSERRGRGPGLQLACNVPSWHLSRPPPSPYMSEP